MPQQDITISQQPEQDIAQAISRCPHDRLFVLTDTTTRRLCWPLVSSLDCLHGAQMVTIEEKDEHKTLESLQTVWKALQDGGATRHSLLVNLGGGMVTDLGGFAASTFKRGMPYLNIPTTLLSQVDASVGGKTGINFGGMKNEIGVFSSPKAVVICGEFLRSLDTQNLLSGFAEMLKHGLLSDEAHLAELLRFDLDDPDYTTLTRLIGKSVAVKERIVTQDPTEQGIRKALNLGHTAGHAIESLALESGHPVLHGYAVAWGLICALYLSTMKTQFPKQLLRQMVCFIREHYGDASIGCKQYDRLYEFMTHDKKNHGNTILFTLLGGIGDIRTDQPVGRDEIFEMLDFLREGG